MYFMICFASRVFRPARFANTCILLQAYERNRNRVIASFFYFPIAAFLFIRVLYDIEQNSEIWK